MCDKRIRETIESPAEIWTGFSKGSDTGAVKLRRRYVKMIKLRANRTGYLIADEQGGNWVSFNFFVQRDSRLDLLRTGVLAYLRN